MAKFDWIPYLEGKYLSYYQWFAVIGSTVMLIFAFLSFVIYLGLSKIKFHEQEYQEGFFKNKNFIERLKNIFFNSTFIFLSLIPLICAALDVTYCAVGILGMSAILVLLIFLDNGRHRWNNEMHNVITESASSAFFKLAFQIDPKILKLIKKVAIISLVANLFMYRTCLCFYNDDIIYYNKLLGFGINTYATRFLQL